MHSSFRQCISNTDMEMSKNMHRHRPLLIVLNAIECISRKTIGACTHKLLSCIWRLWISN